RRDWLRRAHQHGAAGYEPDRGTWPRASRPGRYLSQGSKLRSGAPAGLTEGAVIADVSPGSPAEQGGIRKGDIVVAADGTPIRNAARLRNKLGLTPVGERVHLTVKRKGLVHNLS